jgi:hypothetical protein
LEPRAEEITKRREFRKLFDDSLTQISESDEMFKLDGKTFETVTYENHFDHYYKLHRFQIEEPPQHMKSANLPLF